MKDLKPTKYEKHHSFGEFRQRQGSIIDYQAARAVRLLEDWKSGTIRVTDRIAQETNFSDVLQRALGDLQSEEENGFRITAFIAAEMSTCDDASLLRFLYHRYRYDQFPRAKEIDRYPPYLQIEPAALCNYRCVFCYQTDGEYFNRSNTAMGQMSLDLFQRIVDAVEGNIEFISLASRGEPLLCRSIGAMLHYCEGKFLNMKLNTNASLLNEKNIHAILSGGVKTVVFSADAAEEPLYSQLRVNGKLDRVVKNIELFSSIRARDYSDKKLITRVSGVKVSDAQDIESMYKLWGGLVDQVAFVNYNPWENVYEAKPNGIEAPCSDLWRRMFVWHDGAINPCDTDYRSTLRAGSFEQGISEIWSSDHYEGLRKAHLEGNRNLAEPCRRCSVV